MNNDNLDINKKNSDYYDQLMTEAGTNKDIYYDKKNPFVRIILLVLLIIIIIGTIIIISMGI